MIASAITESIAGLKLLDLTYHITMGKDEWMSSFLLSLLRSRYRTLRVYDSRLSGRQSLGSRYPLVQKGVQRIAISMCLCSLDAPSFIGGSFAADTWIRQSRPRIVGESTSVKRMPVGRAETSGRSWGISVIPRT